MTTTWRQDLHQLIKSVSENKGILLTYPLMVEFLQGDHIASIFINQVLYWTDRTTDPDGWYYKTFDEWKKELQLSYYQVNRVIHGDKRVAKSQAYLVRAGARDQSQDGKERTQRDFLPPECSPIHCHVRRMASREVREVTLYCSVSDTRYGRVTHWSR